MENIKIENTEKIREGMELENKDNEAFRKVIFEPIRIGPISTLEEMDCKVLQFQNKKLEMKLEEYQRIENELQQRIEQLEKRQSQDKIVINIVNRFWNHLNEDVKTMLFEFDDECQNTAEEIENETAVSFIKTLAAYNESQVDEKLLKNIEMSTSALTKIIQAYVHILEKNEEIVAVLKSLPDNSSDMRKNPHDLETLLNFDENTFLLNKIHQSIEDVDHLKRAVKNSYNISSNINHEYLFQNSKLSESPDNLDQILNESRYITDATKIMKTIPNSKIVTEKTNEKISELEIMNEPQNCVNSHMKTITFIDNICENEIQLTNVSSEIDNSIKLVVAEIVDQIANKLDNCGSETFNGNVEDTSHFNNRFSSVSENKKNEDRDHEVFTSFSNISDKVENKSNSAELHDSDNAKYHEKLSAIKMTSDRMKEKLEVSISVLKELKNACTEITNDNVRLQYIINTFQDHYVQSSLNEQNIVKALKSKEQEYDEWKIRVDDIEYENEKLKYKKFKIERHLTEAADNLEKLKVCERNREKSDSSTSSSRKYEELEEELKLQRNLVMNRSEELESLRAKYQNNLDLIEELENSLNNLPENVIEDTAEYKCLQSQFSILYNDTIRIKDQIEEYHAHIHTLNATFTNKMEMTETEDLMTLRKLQTDLLQMQQVNSQLRREYQMLKMEFERNLVANEQTGPLNKEMRHLLIRLQKHNKHLKHEAQRYKRKYQDLNAELNMLSKQSYSDKFKMESEGGSGSDFDENDYALDVNDDFTDFSLKEEPLEDKKEKLDLGYDDPTDISINLYDRPIMAISIKQEPDINSPDSTSAVQSQSHHQNFCNAVAGPSRACSKFSRKRHRDTIQECRELLNRGSKDSQEFPEIEDIDDEKLSEDEYVQDLKNQLKKTETEQKELKLLLDTYKSVNRDKREKVQLLHAEKKLKTDIEEMKIQMRRIVEIKRENRKKLADEDALRKIKYLEEQNFLLLRQINIHKQEEEALLSEMEVTNQAFEDMQEQNSGLIQQLREKDDANSKLMAERIKSNLLYKITREEKESLQALINATTKQLDSVTTVMNELEEKEQVYQTAINNLEKEINLRQQSLELHRKKALEYAQNTSELKLNLEKYLADMKEAKQQISEKSSAFDAENFKYNRLKEEIAILQKRVERMKKVDPSETPDIVLVEEVREYKEMLTCQSCKVRRKDAVLSKCFHVFCWECLRTRYETRQRKCPKCNATFGANDYHRLFFAN